ncbi:MAG: phage protease [Treponemataceae bacterium]
MKKLLLFKSGKYPQGNWSNEDLQNIVAHHSSGKLPDVPLVIAHRYRFEQSSEKDEFAYGWIYSLEHTGNSLYAVDYELSDELKKLIATKKLRYMSVELVRGDAEHGENPYIQAVALLGRNNPAITLARLPEVFSKLNAWINGKSDDKSTTVITEFNRALITSPDALLNDNSSNNISSSENQISINKKGGHSMNGQNFEALQQQNAQLLAKVEKYEAEKQEIVQKQKLLEAQTFYKGLSNEGKITPAQVEQFTKIDLALPEKERDEQRKLVASFSIGIGNLQGKTQSNQSTQPADVSEAIGCYAKEHNLSYEDAAKIMYEKNKEIFDNKEAS